MKPSLPLALACAVTAVCGAAAAPAADVCSDLVRGQSCTNAQGQDSRCGHDWVCMPSITPCAADATQLQRCRQDREAFCFPMADGAPLQCLDAVQIETIVQRDACKGQRDGALCKNAFVEGLGDAGLVATVFEKRGRCEEDFCLSEEYTACDDRSAGAACTITSIVDGNIVLVTGECVPEEPYRPWCRASGNTTVVLSRATVVLANTALPSTAATPSRAESKPPIVVVANHTAAPREMTVEQPQITPLPSKATSIAVGSTSAPRLALPAAALTCLASGISLLVM